MNYCNNDLNNNDMNNPDNSDIAYEKIDLSNQNPLAGCSKGFNPTNHIKVVAKIIN